MTMAMASRRTRKQKRAALILAGLALLSIAAGLVLYALNDTIVFFYTPSEIAEKNVPPGQRFRLGGLVETGSIVRGEGMTVTLHRHRHDQGRSGELRRPAARSLPRRPGRRDRGQARLRSGNFIADTVLAKHDETYMPKDVADRLKEKGVWKEGKGAGP